SETMASLLADHEEPGALEGGSRFFALEKRREVSGRPGRLRYRSEGVEDRRPRRRLVNRADLLRDPRVGAIHDGRFDTSRLDGGERRADIQRGHDAAFHLGPDSRRLEPLLRVDAGGGPRPISERAPAGLR